MIAGSIEIQLMAGIARLQKDMDQARRVVSDATNYMAQAASAARTALMSLGTGLSLTAVISQVSGAQRRFDVLNSSLITATGSVQSASGAFKALSSFASATPYALAEVTQAFVKLRNMGMDPSEAALKSYGNTAAAMGKSLNQMVEAVADAATGEFERLKEFGIKAKQNGDQVALTFQGVSSTIGNNARDIEKYLQKLGETEFAGGMDLRAKTLDGAISNLGDTWETTMLKFAQTGGGDIARESVIGITGALTDLTAILDAASVAADNEGDSVRKMGVIHRGLTTIFESVAVLGINIAYTFTQVGKELGGLAAQATAVVSGDLAGAKRIGEMMRADAAKSRIEVDARTAAILGASAKAQKAMEDEGAARKKTGADALAQFRIEKGAAAESDDAIKKRASAVKKEMDAYLSIVTPIREKIAANKLELIGYEQLSETQKMTIKLDEAVASGKSKLTPKHIAEARALIEMAAAQEDAIAAKARWSKIDEQVAKNDSDYQAGLRAGTKALDDQIEAMTRQIDTYGMTESAVHQLSLAKLEADLAAKPLDIAALIALDAQIERTKTLISLAGKKEILDDSKKTTDQIAADYKRLSENIESSLTDSLMRGFESGKSFGRNLIDTLKNMFKTLILQPTIQGILAPVSGALAGSMIPGAASAVTGGGSNAGSAVSGLGMLGSLTSGAGLLGAGGLGIQAGFGALMSGGFAGVGAAVSGGIAAIGAGTGASIAAGMGTIAGALGPIALGIGAAVVLLNKAFGRGPKEVTGTSLSGMFTSDGFSGTNDSAWKKEGGWLRSDKTGVDKTAIDAATAKQFAAGYDALKAASADFAQVLGINAESIKTRVQSMSIALTKDDEANKKAIADFFTGVGDSIARELLPSLASFAKEGEGASATLQRLATNYATIDAALTALGLSFGAVGVESLSARERLVTLSGGIESFAENAAGFAQNFLTEAQRIAPVAAAVEKAMSDLGYATVDTRAEFATLAMGLDLTTEEGAKTWAALMKIQGAFAQVYPPLEAVVGVVVDLAEAARIASEEAKAAAASLLGNVDGAMSVLQRVTDREKAVKAAAHAVTMKALQQEIDASSAATAKRQALSDSITSALGQMSTLGGDSGSRASAQAQITAALAMARAGAMPTAESLRGPLSILSKDSSDMFATMQDYQRDFYRTQNELAELGKLSDIALSVEEKTLAALVAQKDATQAAFDAEMARLDAVVESAQKQIDLLNGIDTSGITIIQALEAVRLAILSAQQNPVVTATASINGAYQSSLGRAPDAAGMEYWKNQAANGMSSAQIAAMINGSAEAKAQALFHSVLGRAGDAGGVAYWTKALADGMSEQAARDLMKQSDEFKNMPRFENGGNHSGGIRAVGEVGIEIEATGASRIHSTRDIISSLRSPDRSNAVLASAVERLNATVERQSSVIANQQEALDKIAAASKRTADGFETVTEGFVAMRTKPEEDA